MSESRRLHAVQAPIIPVIADLIRTHPGTISLGQGVVGYGPPPEAQAGIERFLAEPANHKYQAVGGVPAFVAALEARVAAENGVRVGLAHGNRLMVTAGGNNAFFAALLAIADPGDEILLPVPYYFNHEMAVVMAGAKAVAVPTTSEYQLDLRAIEAAITPRTRAVVTVSPNNPTGAVYPEADLRAVNALCRDRGIFHIHDEAYEYFTYGGVAHFSPGSLPEASGHTISLYSLSKAYGMASWRIGYMVIPDVLDEAVNKIQDTILICPPAVSQHAALAALAVGRSFAGARLAGLDATRRKIFEALSAGDVPCDVPTPDGAFYYLVRVRSSLDSMTICERLIREHRVATIPGSAFADPSPCSVRISYGALDSESVIEGLRRLVGGLRALAR
jgi:aspartate/methionine/tyrosine aminotransferase